MEEREGEGEEKGRAVEEVGWGEFGFVVEVVGFSGVGSIGLGRGVNGTYRTCQLSGETTAVPGKDFAKVIFISSLFSKSFRRAYDVRLEYV